MGRTKDVPVMDASTKDTPMPPNVHLDHNALKQMGMHTGPMPTPDDKMPISGTAHVKSVGVNSQGERHMMVELHDIMMKKAGGKGTRQADEATMGKGMKAAVDKAVAKGE